MKWQFLFGSLLILSLLSFKCSENTGTEEVNPGLVEIILQIKGSVDEETMKKELKKYPVQFKKEISASMNIWLVEGDTSGMSGKALLDTLKKHPNILETQYNKKLQQR